MIRASFQIRRADAAFRISGHAGAGKAGEDIVCAAVSSAAYMTANTVTEILGVKADADVRDGFMAFSFQGSPAAADLARGLLLHLRELQAQYPNHINIETEVEECSR